jgi:hypothetical protein
MAPKVPERRGKIKPFATWIILHEDVQVLQRLAWNILDPKGSSLSIRKRARLQKRDLLSFSSKH